MACQCHLDKETARQCQAANRRQRLLDERAAHICQKAAHQEAACAAQCFQAALEHHEAMGCQHILNKEAASRQCAAHARQTVAARIIFLWLRRRRLHVRLACQTLRQQQREAALARLRYKQECCSRAAMADEWQRQAAATREKALADEADEWRCQEEAAHPAALVDMALTKERHCHETATIAEMVAEKVLAQLAAILAEMVSTAEQHRHEAATREKASANEADKQCHHKTAAQEKALANKTNKQRHHEMAVQEKALADDPKSQRCRESAARAAALA